VKYARFLDSAGTVHTGRWNNDSIVVGSKSFGKSTVTVLPPTQPSKIVCVGLNYADHAEEEGLEVPDRPMLFLKPPDAVAAHRSTIDLPRGIDDVEYEAELGVVIGEECREVDEADATSVIAGFTCLNDVSNRKDQRVEQNWVRGKAFDNSAPVGPVVATPDEVPADAHIELRLNGEVRQESSRSELIFSVFELIAEITEHLTLREGDIISTGTTAGVGRLEGGDEVEIEVEGVGTLRHSVRRP